MKLREGAERPGRETAWAALFFLAVTVLLTWPQAAHVNDALSDVGDAKLVARILEWDFHQTLRDPANLFQLDFFHPSRYVLAFSENLWGVALFGFPLLAGGGSPLANYNVLLLAGMFFSALSAWALARYVTGDPIAAVLAGLVFAFVPWRFSQLAHLQFQWAGFLSLSLLFLLRYLDGGRRRDAILFGAAFGWNALCNIHYAIFGGFLVALTLVVSALQGRGDARRWRGAVLAAAVGGLVFVPFALPYREASALYGMRRYMGEMLAFSGRWGDFLSAGDRNRLYGRATVRWRGAEGDFFPGILPVALAVVAIVRLRRRGEAHPDGDRLTQTGTRRVAARVLDVPIALLAIAWIWSRARPELRLGPLLIRDPGRVLVLLTIAVLLRLAVAFPAWAKSRDLADRIRRTRLDPLAALFVAIGAFGVLIALGGHTPYYRFLFQSLGSAFRVIRAPARGIVLFHLALGVFAAWGLAELVRGKSLRRRLAWTAVAVALVVVEYRAFPLALEPTEAQAPAVYRWLATADFPGAVVEWPFGLIYDFDYVFRQAQHERPLVNGFSGFFPRSYLELDAELRRRPIPDTVWARMGALDAGLLVYHAHEGRGFNASAYADAIDRALASGGLEVVRSFPHRDGLDFVFIAAGAPWRDRVMRGAGDPAGARRLYEGAVVDLRRSVARLAPPIANLHRPREGEEVAPGFWAHGWALDDSGMAAIRVSTDAGPAGEAALGGPWPGLADVFPDYPEARTGGSFGFP
ncbi:MAG TPA: hypothetical protein VN032_01170, partial [Thermoanaerobaculia bacterium]|nr:hypothetical protein [Thermoanaerobaculia bacterium]